jgi:surface polysaccharide O-acyltransferase-like enzyme
MEFFMEKKHLDWVTNLRAICTIAVIFLHVSAGYVGNYKWNPDQPSWWFIANLVDGFMRFCVPGFVMISGFLWLSGSESISEFYKKKVLRLIGPLLFWSFVFYLFNIFFMKTQSSHVHILEDFFHKFRLDLISAHFWYVYMLIGLFLIAPVFRGWVKNANEKEIRIFLIVWIAVLLYQNSVFDSIRIAIELQMIYGYAGYMVLGYYLSHHISFSSQQQKNAGKILFFTGSILTIGGTYIVSGLKNEFYDKFYDYLSINVVMASSGIFLWIKNATMKIKWVSKGKNSIGKYGYGIYLCHVMLLYTLTKNWFWPAVNPLIVIPAVSSATLILSWGLIFLLNKIPFAKYLIG